MVATRPCPACGNHDGRTCPWCAKTGRVMIPVPIQFQKVVCCGFSAQPSFFDGMLKTDVVRTLFAYVHGAWRSITCEYLVDPQRGYQCEHCWISYQFVETQKAAWINLFKRTALSKTASAADDHPIQPPTPNEPESACSSPNGHADVPFLESALSKPPVARNADFKRRISEIVSKKEVRMIKKSRQRLPQAAVAIMQEWFMEHLRRPYPNDAEKIELAKRTDLSVAQVINWFTNTRKRVWLPSKAESEANKKRRCLEPSLLSLST